MEILFYIFSVLLIVALLVLLIVPIWHGIKQAKNESKGESEQIAINIVITDKDSKS